jgi:hypothetical protein
MGVRTMIAAAAVTTVSLTAATVPSASAAAHTEHGCPYPRVCFFKTEKDWNAKRPAGSFKDVTSRWQRLTTSKGSFAVYNTRDDDIAYLHFTDGSTVCMDPNDAFIVGRNFVVDAVRISWASHC